MYLAAGEFFKAADVMIENGWVDRYTTERLLYMLYEIALLTRRHFVQSVQTASYDKESGRKQS